MKHWKTKNGYEIWKVLNLRSNAFLLTNGKQNLLIDCGGRQYRRQLVWNLAKLGIIHIDALILTHSHFDHAGNSHYIQQRFNANIIIHQEEFSCLFSGSSPLPRGTNRLTRFMINHVADRFSTWFKYRPCEADIVFTDSVDLSRYGFDARVEWTPGHSPGSASILIDNEIVLAGDTLFGIFPSSTWPPFADNTLQMVKSWKKLLDTGASLFLPSHGSERTRDVLEKNFTKYNLIS